MRIQLICIGLLIVVLSIGAAEPQQKQLSQPQQKMDVWQALEISLRNAKSIRPQKGFVPDESTAVKIGQAVASAQYGEARVLQEMPFHARLYGDTWTVKGTLHPVGALGGTAVIKLRKTDGKILFMMHQE